MTTGHAPGYFNAVSERQARVHRATQTTHPIALALASNCALLDQPASIASTGWTETGGVYSFSYVRNPGARYVRFEARIAPVSLTSTATVQLKLTARDATGNAVLHGDDRIPDGFKSETHAAPHSLLIGPRFAESLAIVGYVDCDALDDDLTDPTWHFDLEVSVSGGGTLDGMQLFELPRFAVDDTATHGGVIPGSFQRDAVIHSGSDDGLVRLVSTQESARLSQRSYLALSWLRSTTPADTPSVSATSYTPFTLLDAGADAVRFAVPTRSVHAASSAGEVARWRFLYRFDGGAGTETASVRLYGSATGSPWTKSLTYTTSWTWSPWVAAAVRTSPATDALSLKGLVSASGPTLWIAAVHVAEAVAPF